MKYAGIALKTGESYTPFHAALSASWQRPEPSTHWAELMYDQGTLPFVHLMIDDNIWSIANGDHDAELEDWFMALLRYQASGRTIVLLLLPEMNGNWTPYGQEEPLDYGAFIRAYRHIVDMGRAMGLNREHVMWAWGPNNTGFPGDSLESWYPGDAWCDLVGMSCYNWGGIVPDRPWETPIEVIEPYVDDVREFTSRKIVITQTGSGLNDTRTPEWLDQLSAYTQHNDIEGMIWFDIGEFSLGEGVDWNSQTAALSGDRPDHWFTTEVPMIHFDLDQWQWGSRTNYPDGTKRPFNMDKIVIHWGGLTNPGSGQDDEMAILRGWQRYHIDSKGWTDIAYNFAVGNSGLSYRLRGINRSGATSGDYEDDGIPENQEALAIVWIGGQGHGISEAAKQTMGRLIRESGQSVVIGHRNVKATACPGDEWLNWIDVRGWEDDSVPIPTPPVEGDHQMQTVKRGDGYKANPAKKATVKAAQIMEAFHGFFDEKTEDNTCGADGIFGPGTETATKNFQQANGLVIDGQVGPETWKALEA